MRTYLNIYLAQLASGQTFYAHAFEYEDGRSVDAFTICDLKTKTMLFFVKTRHAAMRRMEVDKLSKKALIEEARRKHPGLPTTVSKSPSILSTQLPLGLHRVELVS